MNNTQLTNENLAEEVLPQANFVTTHDMFATLPAHVTFTLPKTMRDLFDIADSHNHALRHYAPETLSGSMCIFTLTDENEGELFTYELFADVNNERFGQVRHAVGENNKLSPTALTSIAAELGKRLLKANLTDKD